MSDSTSDPASSTAYVGRFVTMRAVGRADYPLFLRWRTDIKELHIWSSSRLLLSVEGFNAEMDQLLRQSATLLALDNQNGEPIGFLQAYNMNPTDGWCMMRVYFRAEYRAQTTAQEACLAFLDYLFGNFALRKIYLDVHEFNQGLLGSALEGALSEEGRFREHTWYEDRYWDVIRFALYRDTWVELREHIHFMLGVGAEAAELLAEQEKGRAEADP